METDEFSDLKSKAQKLLEESTDDGMKRALEKFLHILTNTKDITADNYDQSLNVIKEELQTLVDRSFNPETMSERKDMLLRHSDLLNCDIDAKTGEFMDEDAVQKKCEELSQILKGIIVKKSETDSQDELDVLHE